MRAFPWDAAMQLGFGVMHLSSREFWGLSPRELAAAFAAASGRVAPPSRGTLEGLMQAFPDGEKRNG